MNSPMPKINLAPLAASQGKLFAPHVSGFFYTSRTHLFGPIVDFIKPITYNSVQDE